MSKGYFRFSRRLRIAPGLSLNFSKSGVSFSAGPRGAKVTVGKKGIRQTVGIPGTGLHHTRHVGYKSTPQSTQAKQSSSSALDLGVFQRMSMSSAERAFVDGLKLCVEGDEAAGMEVLRKADTIADAVFMLGILLLKKKRYQEAADILAAVIPNQLGVHFQKYGVALALSIYITEDITAAITPDIRGLLLVQVEVLQRLKHWEKAEAMLQDLLQINEHDVVAAVSMAELLWDRGSDDAAVCKRIVSISSGLTPADDLREATAALQLYRARALRVLNLLDAARQTLSTALRRKSGVPAELLHALRYERALVYQKLGHNARARSDLEQLYAQDPAYRDVAKQLGL